MGPYFPGTGILVWWAQCGSGTSRSQDITHEFLSTWVWGQPIPHLCPSCWYGWMWFLQFHSCQTSIQLDFWCSWMMVGPYFRCDLDVAVGRGEPCLPMLPSWPDCLWNKFLNGLLAFNIYSFSTLYRYSLVTFSKHRSDQVILMLKKPPKDPHCQRNMRASVIKSLIIFSLLIYYGFSHSKLLSFPNTTYFLRTLKFISISISPELIQLFHHVGCLVLLKIRSHSSVYLCFCIFMVCKLSLTFYSVW